MLLVLFSVTSVIRKETGLDSVTGVGTETDLDSEISLESDTVLEARTGLETALQNVPSLKTESDLKDIDWSRQCD